MSNNLDFSQGTAPLRKGPWTPEEDQKLIAYIKRYGIWNWSHMPKYAGLRRSGKSCRMRWINYLRPDIRRGNFTQEEIQTIINLQATLGNRWSAIATKLPGRTDNEIKNYWNTHLRNRLRNKVVEQTMQLDNELEATIASESNDHSSENRCALDNSYATDTTTLDAKRSTGILEIDLNLLPIHSPSTPSSPSSPSSKLLIGFS